MWIFMLYISDVESGFMPWLMDQVEEQLNRVVVGRAVLDALIREIVKAREDSYGPPPAPADEEEATPAAPQTPTQVSIQQQHSK